MNEAVCCLIITDKECVCVSQTVKAFLPQMKAQNHGHIVTIASVLGLFSTACVEVRDHAAQLVKGVDVTDASLSGLLRQ